MSASLPMVFDIGRETPGSACSLSRCGSPIHLKGDYAFGTVSVRDFVMCNHSSDPVLSSGTSRAGHEPRHR
jgi:hypothetical protein